MTEMIERLAWRISRFRLEQDGVDVSKWEPGAILAARKMALDTHRELAVAVLEEMRPLIYAEAREDIDAAIACGPR